MFRGLENWTDMWNKKILNGEFPQKQFSWVSVGTIWLTLPRNQNWEQRLHCYIWTKSFLCNPASAISQLVRAGHWWKIQRSNTIQWQTCCTLESWWDAWNSFMHAIPLKRTWGMHHPACRLAQSTPELRGVFLVTLPSHQAHQHLRAYHHSLFRLLPLRLHRRPPYHCHCHRHRIRLREESEDQCHADSDELQNPGKMGRNRVNSKIHHFNSWFTWVSCYVHPKSLPLTLTVTMSRLWQVKFMLSFSVLGFRRPLWGLFSTNPSWIGPLNVFTNHTLKSQCHVSIPLHLHLFQAWSETRRVFRSFERQERVQGTVNFLSLPYC